jgi:hypothetical protein
MCKQALVQCTHHSALSASIDHSAEFLDDGREILAGDVEHYRYTQGEDGVGGVFGSQSIDQEL